MRTDLLQQFPIGTRVCIMMGRARRIGTVKGTKLISSTAVLQSRVVVEVDGKEKSYLPSSLRPVRKGAQG